VTTGGGAPVVLVVPVVPALGGNGLAMRAGMVLEALAEHCEVDLVVVPVSGPLAGTAWASSLARSLVVVEPVSDPATAREHLTRQLADPLLRERLARSAPLPQRARSVPATLAAGALSGLLPRARGARALFVLRGYLAPFGCALARALQAGRVIVDLDDDDEQFERSAGRVQEADAIGRLARAWLPDADIVCAAAPHEASAMAERYGLHLIRVLPNAIRPPAQTTVPPGEQRLLFVGNLTYAPNLDAAQVLAHEILPLVRETNPDATVDLVGPHDGSIVPARGMRAPTSSSRRFCAAAGRGSKCSRPSPTVARSSRRLPPSQGWRSATDMRSRSGARRRSSPTASGRCSRSRGAPRRWCRQPPARSPRITCRRWWLSRFGRS
jgi:hypothetical protein